MQAAGRHRRSLIAGGDQRSAEIPRSWPSSCCVPGPAARTLTARPPARTDGPRPAGRASRRALPAGRLFEAVIPVVSGGHADPLARLKAAQGLAAMTVISMQKTRNAWQLTVARPRSRTGDLRVREGRPRIPCAPLPIEDGRHPQLSLTARAKRSSIWAPAPRLALSCVPHRTAGSGPDCCGWNGCPA